MGQIQYAKELIKNNNTDKAIDILKEITLSEPHNDEAFFLLGNAYSKKNDWQQALNAYCQAITINPESPARLAHERILEILNFYHRDIYNP